MKTITIKQPWASFMFINNGYKPKDIENRTWKTNFRGKVLIHAGASFLDLSEILTDEQFDQIHGDIRYDLITKKLLISAIIGSVEIVDCVINHPSIWAEKSYHAVNLNSLPFYEEDEKDSIIYNWVLANPILFPEPIPAKGKLSFWDYPNILAEPEEKDGELFCHCQLSIDEKIQVSGDGHFGYYCRYCGGKWYK